MTQAAYFADDRLGGPGRGRSGGQHIGDRGVHGGIERILALHDLVDEPIRWARTASNRRPPGKSARACVSPIFAITKGAMTAGRTPVASR